jgi:hypothetical protein
MRITMLLLALSLLSTTAEAKRHKPKHHAKAKAHASAKLHASAKHVVPNDRQAQEHARAESELADLRAGRVSDTSGSAEPAQPSAIQENDREVPRR